MKRIISLLLALAASLSGAIGASAQDGPYVLTCEQRQGQDFRYSIRDYGGSGAELVIDDGYGETVEELELVHFDYALDGILYRAEDRFQVYIAGDVAIVTTANYYTYICRSD